ncbi:hypothetical protein JJE00_00025 [Candidatus Bathyarchaeota archaeon]|nr:hypothetical protein [Candidatus Bathyarchaeota archaeon]
MEIIFDFNSNWYILFFAFVSSWAILLLLRRNLVGKEIKEQIFIGACGLMSMVLLELFAVSVGLWDYTPGNWPVILWPTYVAAILFGYQLLRSVETLLHKPLVTSQLK